MEQVKYVRKSCHMCRERWRWCVCIHTSLFPIYACTYLSTLLPFSSPLLSTAPCLEAKKNKNHEMGATRMVKNFSLILTAYVNDRYLCSAGGGCWVEDGDCRGRPSLPSDLH